MALRIPIKPKLGKWCNYYEGRLPFPMECSTNKSMPVSKVYKGKDVIVIRNTPDCPTCKRAPEFYSWKRGDWDKIKKAISKGEDLRDMPVPIEQGRSE